MGVVKSKSKCSTVGIQGIAWAFGGMIFALVYCTAGISVGAAIGWVRKSSAPLVLVYTVFSATDAKRNARDSHVPILVPLPIGFAVFLVNIPITGTGINPARSLGAAIIYDKDHAWDDQWIFWVGPFIGAALAASYHQVVIRAIPFKSGP